MGKNKQDPLLVSTGWDGIFFFSSLDLSFGFTAQWIFHQCCHFINIKETIILIASNWQPRKISFDQQMQKKGYYVYTAYIHVFLVHPIKVKI